MTEDEIWKPIPGFEGHYEASSLGRIRSLARVTQRRTKAGVRPYRVAPRILKQARRGYQRLYFYVNLKLAGKQTSMSVHLAVLLAHEGPAPFDGAEVLHGPNHDPGDNRRCNLRWGTHEENNHDRNVNNGYAGFDMSNPMDAIKMLEDAKAAREAKERFDATFEEWFDAMYRDDPFLRGETPF